MRLLFSIFVLGFASLPNYVFAQTGFVPCSGTNCDTCHLVQMGNSILVWLIGILFLLFAFMVFVAGWKLITSGGNTSAKEAAKSQLTNAIIGIIIVLAAWLIVDTLMRALLSTVGPSGPNPQGYISGYGPWSQVQCGSQAATNWVVQQNYSSVTTAPVACGGPPPQPSCASVAANCTALGGTPNVTGGSVSCTTATGINASSTPTNACDASLMTTINFLGHSATVDNRLVSKLNAINSQWQSLGGNSFYSVRSVGSYNCRKVTGGSNWSYHAYGFALDINPSQNPYVSPKPAGGCPTDMTSMSPTFVSLFTSQGFGWGGNWSSLCDAMHFSAASGEGGWLPRP